MQVPFGAGRPGHTADGHPGVAILVMRELPDSAKTSCVAARRLSERGDVLGRRSVRQGRQLGGVLPAFQLASSNCDANWQIAAIPAS